jgi:enoyl-CoA hydratase/carnithine racemase
MIEAEQQTYEHVLYEGDDTVALVSMNRPKKRNALSLDHMRELISCLKVIGEARESSVVVLRGNGPAFCAGHDLSEMVGRDPEFYRRLFDVCCELMETIQSLRSPSLPRSTASLPPPDASSLPPATSSSPPKTPASPPPA